MNRISTQFGADISVAFISFTGKVIQNCKKAGLLLATLLFLSALHADAQSATALSFDGTRASDPTYRNYVAVNSPFRNFNKEITVEYWMYIPSNIMPYGSIMGQGTNNVDDMNYNVWLMHPNTDGTMSFYVNDAGTWRGAKVDKADFIAGSWHHYAGVANAASTKVYIDGVLKATGPGVSNSILYNSNAVLHIGKDVRYDLGQQYDIPRYATMTIDEVRIWDRALCQEEIQNNMNCQVSAQANLQELYHFNNSSATAGGNNAGQTTLTDASGFGRNGVLTNFLLTGTASNWVTSGSTNTGNCSAFVAPTAPINGAGNVAVGATITLTNAIPNGVWKSGNTTVATINPSTGVVTGVGTGTTIMSYTNECGGISVATITVGSPPAFTLCATNKVVGNDPNQCSAVVSYTVTASGSPAPTFTYTFSGATSGTGSGTGSGQSFNAGVTNVTVTANNNSGSATCSFTVTVNAPDSDGDGIPDACDDDADNDGIPNVMECNKSNFFWSNPPTVSGYTATGTINGIGYTYTSSSPVTTTSNMYGNSNFPASYGVPNSNPTIQNIYVTNNTITFASPMTNPVLVFASIGQAGLRVPISFGAPVQVVWSQNVTVNSSTQITGEEGYAIVRMMGTFSSISFNYQAEENWCNFAFGADFMSCPDTDGDGIPDYLDTDSDNDGCPDAIEGSMSFSMTQTNNGRLTGGVNSRGIPLLAGAGQDIGTSKNYAVNCFCQAGLDEIKPVALAKNITVNLNASGTASITASQIDNGSTDNCSIASRSVSKTSFDCSNLGANTVTLTVTDNDGNTGTATATVTVNDVTPPTINCPANKVLASCETVIPDYTTSATISDNCTPSGSIVVTQSPAAGTAIASGATVTVTLTAKDASNNAINCSFTVNRPNVTPVANNDAATVCAGSNVTINVLNNDSHPQNLPLIVSDNTIPSVGSLVKNADNTFTYIAPANYSGPVSFTYTTKANDGTQAFSGNGHFYEFVSAPGITWQAAKTAAAARTFNGLQGYLVTVTSAAEQVFVTAKLAGAGWMGSSDLAYEGTWRWVTGPEGLENGGQGRIFTTQLKYASVYGNCNAATGQSVNGSYINWNGGEPNDCGAYLNQYSPTDLNRGGEHFGHFYGGSGLWNDFPNNATVQGYVVEYGGLENCLPVLTATATVTITVNNLKFTAVPSNQSVTTANGTCAAVVNYAATVAGTPTPAVSYTFTGATTGSGSGTGSGATFNTGVTNVVITATNSCGTVSTSFTVTVTDKENPTITAPAAISVNNDPGKCSAVVNLGTPSTNDNCGVASTTNNAPAAFPVGTTLVTWTVTDVHGNKNTATQSVTVTDNENPTITAPAAITVNNDPGKCSAVVNLGIPVTGDNCAVANTTNNAPAAFPVGTTIVTWIVTDIHGNSSMATQTVTVTDNEIPTITAPAAISVNNDPGKCSAVVDLGTPATGDNCGVNNIANDAPAAFPVGTTIVTWTVTDIHGNKNTATQSVTVTDNENPTITAPAAITVNNDPGQCSAVVNLGTPATGDNCAVDNITNNAPASLIFPVGTTIVTWIVTDIHGNSSMATQTITVTDNQAPVITTNGNKSVNNDPGKCGAVVAVSANADDNCGVGAPAGVRSDALALTDPYPVGSTTITWTVTDIHGNSSTTAQTVTVTDNEKPALTTPANQVFCANFGGVNTYTIPALVAVDNCGIASISYTVSGATTRSGSGTDASGIFAIGVSTVTFTVTDIHNNINTASFTVTINPLPVASITPSTADAFCNKLTLTGSSTLSGPFSYQWTYANGNFSNTNPISLGLLNGDGVYGLYTTDGNGCRSEFAATYNYQKQNLSSSYTIIGYKEVELGSYNTLASGSIGVMSNKGEAEFGKYSKATAPGSFVKAVKIELDKNASVSQPIYAAATPVLPTMLYNTASTKSLPKYEVKKGTTIILSGNYSNLNIQKGSVVTLTGTTFGSIHTEEGVQLTFTQPNLNIDQLNIDKGPKTGYSYVHFAPDTKVLVSKSVSIGDQVYLNPENNKVTFYVGSLQDTRKGDDDRSDDTKFSVNAKDSKITVNVMMPNGKLKVNGGDEGNDDDHDGIKTNGTTVNMTGLFIAAEVEGEGKNVIWNSFDCSAPPVATIVTSTVASQTAFTKDDLAEATDADLKVTVMPNPSSSYFTLKLESRYNTPVNMRVMDANGRVIENRSKIGANSTLQVGADYSSGMYYAEMIQGTKRKVVQLIKVR